jgi:hypothetical protein
MRLDGGGDKKEQSLDPYVGPRPFGRSVEDLERFYGRAEEMEEIISLILGNQLSLIYSQSGAGKTSLLNTKVLATLETHYGFEVLSVARVRISSTIAIGSNSFSTDVESSPIANTYVFNALQTMNPEIDPRLLINKSLSGFLNDYFPIKKDIRGRPSPQIIIFDQLEELFGFYPDRWREQQEDFFKQVADALNNNPALRVVFVIREDYLAQLDPFTRILPGRLKSRFRLERLRKDAALLAVKGPLIRANIVFDKELIDKIDNLVEDLLRIRVETLDGQIQEIKGEFVEPIQLQIVCRRIWAELRFSQIDQINQDDSGYLVDVDRALEDFYVEAIREAVKQTNVSENIIRNWFEEKLITSSGTRGIVHRDVKATGGIPNRTVDILEQKYVIRKEQHSGAQWYELTHDRLIDPIKNSNMRWKEKERKMRSRRNRLIIIPAGVAVAAAVAITLLLVLFGPG